MKKNNLLIDTIALLALLISFLPDLTGLGIHEWLGLALGGVLLIHLLQHWQWFLTVTQNLFHSKPKVWQKYLVDMTLGLSFFVIVFSGVIISTLLMLPLKNYETWWIVHVLSSYTTLVMIAMKLAIHWDMLAKTINKCFKIGDGKKVLVSERRKFIRTCGITALAAVLAIFEFQDWQEKVAGQAAFSDNDEIVENEGFEATEPVVIPDETAAKTTATPEKIVQQATETSDPVITATIDAKPTMAPVAETGVVRCSRGCSYPGKCRRYQDTVTANGKCDLGEAIW